MGAKVRTVEQVMGRFGSSAKGVVTRRELLAAGVTRAEVEHRLRGGALI
jgi:hypothetical protein